MTKRIVLDLNLKYLVDALSLAQRGELLGALFNQFYHGNDETVSNVYQYLAALQDVYEKKRAHMQNISAKGVKARQLLSAHGDQTIDHAVKRKVTKEKRKNIYDKSVELNKKYDNFIEAIDSWDCSEDFNSIKEFAINQCEISKENLDYYEKEIIKYQKLLDKIETSKYEVQCEIDKHRNTIIANIKSFQDYINRIKEQNNKYESNKEFYDRFVKEIENIKFKI